MSMQGVDYIIVQAGGRGSRMGALTANKPKALVPIDNKPIIFHLFQRFPKSRFLIIADYQKEVLRRYLSRFATVDCQIVEAEGEGTCSGIGAALACIPEGTPFMLSWCDLVFSEAFVLPQDYRQGVPQRNYVGLSGTFPCRWRYRDGVFDERVSTESGVAGVFLFADKAELAGIPEEGEFVRWLKESGKTPDAFTLQGVAEFSCFEEAVEHYASKCRPFNRISVTDGVLAKEPIDEQGALLAARERAWYEKLRELDAECIPHIYSLDPLRMEFVAGGSVYERELDARGKERLLEQIVHRLRKLHALASAPTDQASLKEAYLTKTMARLSSVRKLVPFADRKRIVVNGKLCRNVFFYETELAERLAALKCDRFALIHGDCTFSNILVREDGRPVFIDPRGYFGHTELFGDARYDWAKLYYSLVGNYDQFNLKRFRLEIGGEGGTLATELPAGEVRVDIASNGWEVLEERFFELVDADPTEIRLLHAIIWLSLTTYAWQDYDSICGAFYIGLFYLEDVL